MSVTWQDLKLQNANLRCPREIRVDVPPIPWTYRTPKPIRQHSFDRTGQIVIREFEVTSPYTPYWDLAGRPMRRCRLYGFRVIGENDWKALDGRPSALSALSDPERPWLTLIHNRWHDSSGNVPEDERRKLRQMSDAFATLLARDPSAPGLRFRWLNRLIILDLILRDDAAFQRHTKEYLAEFERLEIQDFRAHCVKQLRAKLLDWSRADLAESLQPIAPPSQAGPGSGVRP